MPFQGQFGGKDHHKATTCGYNELQNISNELMIMTLIQHMCHNQ
jgi:hypothetical protein